MSVQNLIIVGEGGVGKTTLINRISRSYFVSQSERNDNIDYDSDYDGTCDAYYNDDERVWIRLKRWRGMNIWSTNTWDIDATETDDIPAGYTDSPFVIVMSSSSVPTSVITANQLAEQVRASNPNARVLFLHNLVQTKHKQVTTPLVQEYHAHAKYLSIDVSIAGPDGLGDKIADLLKC
jgi:GTPase SAR1 family protein